MCYNHGPGCQQGSALMATVSVAAPAATEGALAPAAAAGIKGMEEPTYDEIKAWLTDCGLFSPEEGLSEEQVVWLYNTLSKCTFGKAVREESRCNFLHHLLPCEACLAAKQTDIGWVEEPRYHHCLKLRNEVGIKVHPMCLLPEEEAWLNIHLDELVSKGIIGPILLEE